MKYHSESVVALDYVTNITNQTGSSVRLNRKMKETVELACDGCGKTYLYNHEPVSRDLIGSHYCPECFQKYMREIEK